MRRPAYPSRRLCRPAIAARILTTWVLVTALTSFSFAQAAEPRLVTIDDLYDVDTVIELVVTPNGRQAYYIRKWAEPGFDNYRYSLWRVDGSPDQKSAVEQGEPDARAPLVSPDGKWLVFRSTRHRPDGSAVPPVPRWSEPATDIWLMPIAGGPPRPLAGADKPYGRVFNDVFYGRVAFSPDSKRLVFVADDGVDPRTPDEIKGQATVVRDDQGEGYEGYGTAQIWIAELGDDLDHAAMSIRRVTDDDAWYGDPQWTPDGKSLIVHANRTSDRESVRYSVNKNYDLWRIDVDSGAIEQITHEPGPEVSPRVSPDGRRLLCLSVPRNGPHLDVYNPRVVDLDSPNYPSRLLFDHHAADGDMRPSPTFPLADETWLDERHVQLRTFDRLVPRREFIDIDNPAAVLEADDFPQFAARSEVRESLMPALPKDREGLIHAKAEIVQWTSSDGTKVEGYLTIPPPETGAKPPYKMIVHPHGGPHSRATRDHFGLQLFAAHGYAVFQPNFRGSTGYGLKFLDADRRDFGGGDMQDILTGIDYLVEQGIADRDRQFVYGVSYGGYMTTWLVGHTDQFKAAVAQNPVTDLSMMWHLSDLQSWTEWEFGGLPWEVPELMRERSPLTYASRVKTPTLLLQSDHDRRCPPAMSLAFYRALKKSGCETEMVLFHDARHGIERLPQQAEMYRRVLDWFARHDKGN